MQIRHAVFTVWALVALCAVAHACSGCGSAVFVPEGHASYGPATNETCEACN